MGMLPYLGEIGLHGPSFFLSFFSPFCAMNETKLETERNVNKDINLSAINTMNRKTEKSLVFIHFGKIHVCLTPSNVTPPT